MQVYQVWLPMFSRPTMLWVDGTPWIDEHPIHTASFFSLLDHEKDLMAIHHAGLLLSHIYHTHYTARAHVQ